MKGKNKKYLGLYLGYSKTEPISLFHYSIDVGYTESFFLISI